MSGPFSRDGNQMPVQTTARAFDEVAGEFLVSVHGKVVANFIYSFNRDDWDDTITSKLDALSAARAVLWAEREKLGEPRPYVNRRRRREPILGIGTMGGSDDFPG